MSGQRYGSLINHLVGRSQTIEPEVGMPVTVCHWTDRSPAEIAEVIRFKTGKRAGQIRGVTVRPMEAIQTGGSEFDGSATYRYERRPDWPVSAIYLRDWRGGYRKPNGGPGLALGRAEKHHDPHF